MPPRVSRCGLAAIVAAVAIAGSASVAGAASAPGAPGQRTTRASPDKDGFGTSLGRNSRVWFTRAGMRGCAARAGAWPAWTGAHTMRA